MPRGSSQKFPRGSGCDGLARGTVARCGTKVAADEEVNMLRLLTPLTAALSTLFSSAQVLAADQLRSLSNLPPTDALVIGFVLGALLMALIVKLNRE